MARRVMKAVNALARNPQPEDSVDLGSSRLYRLHIGAYRGMYEAHAGPVSSGDKLPTAPVSLRAGAADRPRRPRFSRQDQHGLRHGETTHGDAYAPHDRPPYSFRMLRGRLIAESFRPGTDIQVSGLQL